MQNLREFREAQKKARNTPLERSPIVSPFAELYKPHRYKVFYGGRGGGKSEAIAEALLFFAAVTQLRILCCREIQNSIADSSYATLKAVAYRLGIASDFEFTKTQISHKKTGSVFVFKGLLRNADSVRSMYGIDIVWVEEAVTVSEQSWQILIPTIRANKSEVWLTFNPDSEDDPTYQRFVVNPPATAYVRKINYDENPFFPEALRLEMEHDRATDYEKYLYVWEGFPRTFSDAQIFKGKFDVEQFSDDLWRKAERLFFGADFGFGQDPSTLVRCFILDSRLYVDYEAYGHHVEINELPELYRSVPESDKWVIHADCSRPETISYLANRKGLRIDGAKKWQGSVEDGIAYLKSFDKIVVHPRCQHTIDELRLYSYKVDPRTAEVLPIIVDKYNHCLDALRYSLDGYITRPGQEKWNILGRQEQSTSLVDMDFDL